MKKWIKGICLALSACLLVGCSSVTAVVDGVVTQVKSFAGIETEEESISYVAPEGATQVTGLVLTAYGNEITLQLAVDNASSSGGMQQGSEESGMTDRTQMVGEGEMPEGMTEGELLEDMTEGEMPEGMTEGEMPEGMTEGELPEGMTEGELPEGMTEGELPEGMTEGESGDTERTQMGADSATQDTQSMPSAQSDSATTESVAPTESASTTDSMPEMSGDASAMGGMSEMSGDASAMGGMGEMSGGMDTTATVDYSSIITLSEETQMYVIPSGTVVEYYGFEMTFSQIEAEQYITITISEEGNILYVEVLG